MAESVDRVGVGFRTEPARYRHWKLGVDGPVATLALDVREDGGLKPGYELKLNSYDLGVDVELYDAAQRLRFEHPEVGAVVVTSGKERVFCAGANIRMLSQSTHGWKVNFCKFTNEARAALEAAGAREAPCRRVRRPHRSAVRRARGGPDATETGDRRRPDPLQPRRLRPRPGARARRDHGERAGRAAAGGRARRPRGR